MFNPLEIFVNNSLWARIDVFFYIAVFLFVFYAVLSNREHLKRGMGDRKVLFSVFSVMFMALVVRLYFYTGSIGIADSVWGYIVAGRKFVAEGLIYKCYGPTFSNCANPVPVSHPALYALISGIFFSFAGFSLKGLIFFNILFSVFTIWFFYQGILRIVESESSIFLGLFGLALVPIHAIYSTTMDGGLAVFSVLSGFMVVLATLLVSEERESFARWLFLAASWVFAVSLRWENPLMILFSLLYLYLSFDDPWSFLKEKLGDRRWLGMMVFAFLLMIVPLKGIYTIWIRPDNIDSGFKIAYVLRNIFGGFGHVLEYFGFVGVFSLVFLPFAFKKYGRRVWAFVFWIAAYFGTYSIFRNGLSLRYVMNLVPAVVFLLLMGFDGFKEFFDLKDIFGKLLVFVMIVLFFFNLSGFSKPESLDEVGLLESVDEGYGDKPVVFADTNTMISYVGITEESPVFGFLSLDNAFVTHGYEEIYFVETKRCGIDVFSDLCGRLGEEGEFVESLNGWHVFRVELDDDLRDYIVESVRNNPY